MKSQAATLSPSGARAVFEAHGEILTAPGEKGDIRNLTNTTGTMERDPAWSPDGKWVAYFSDESGEYQLFLKSPDGMGEPKKISLGTPPSFYYQPVWSPDSKKIAFTDKRLNLWYLDLAKGDAGEEWTPIPTTRRSARSILSGHRTAAGLHIRKSSPVRCTPSLLIRWNRQRACN